MRNLYWVKRQADLIRLVRQLNAHDRIIRAKLYLRFIKVKFKNGITEYWYIRPPKRNPVKNRSFVLPKRGPFLRFAIRTFSEYETRPFDDAHNSAMKPFFIVQYKDLTRAGFADVRIKVHELIDTLAQEGWIELKYPPEKLRKELELIKTTKLVESFLDGPWQKYGFYNIVHFMPLTRYKVNGTIEQFNLSDLWRFRLLYRVINKIIASKRDVTRTSIIKRITSVLNFRYLKITNPMLYRFIFEKFWPVAGKSVLDLAPSWGTRALATVLMGGQYVHMPNYIFEKSLGQMTLFAGRKCEVEDGLLRYNLIIINDFLNVDFASLQNKINQFKARADNLMVMFHKRDRVKIFSNYKPKLMLDLRTRDKYLAII